MHERVSGKVYERLEPNPERITAPQQPVLPLIGDASSHMRANRCLQLVQMLEEIPFALDVFRDVKTLPKGLQLEASKSRR